MNHLTWDSAESADGCRVGWWGALRLDDRLRAWRRSRVRVLAIGGVLQHRRLAWVTELRCPDCDNHYEVLTGLAEVCKGFACSICGGRRWRSAPEQGVA